MTEEALGSCFEDPDAEAWTAEIEEEDNGMYEEHVCLAIQQGDAGDKVSIAGSKAATYDVGTSGDGTLALNVYEDLMEAVMGGDKAAQERLKAKAEEAEAERQAVLAAMEAEKENPALRYDDKKMRTISDVKYSKMKKAEARKKLGEEDSLPDYVVEGLDDELKHIIIETCEVQKGSHAKSEANFEFKSFIENTTSDLKSGNRVNKGALAMTFHKQELLELGLHQTRVRHKPVLERQLLHLRAIKSIQDYGHKSTNNQSSF
ncbi:hypothetical protein L7F22_011891 [Adiantum nelumboides]|nr:hypothetical protein [Adiantum nelumboides]